MNIWCFLGYHEYELLKANPLGISWYKGHYIRLSSVMRHCRKCQKTRFNIEPGNWETRPPAETNDELQKLRKMAGLE